MDQSCNICSAQFGTIGLIYNQRYQCGVCGNNVCGSCSSMQSVDKNHTKKQCCNNCYQSIEDKLYPGQREQRQYRQLLVRLNDYKNKIGNEIKAQEQIQSDQSNFKLQFKNIDKDYQDKKDRLLEIISRLEQEKSDLGSKYEDEIQKRVDSVQASEQLKQKLQKWQSRKDEALFELKLQQSNSEFWQAKLAFFNSRSNNESSSLHSMKVDCRNIENEIEMLHQNQTEVQQKYKQQIETLNKKFNELKQQQGNQQQLEYIENWKHSLEQENQQMAQQINELKHSQTQNKEDLIQALQVLKEQLVTEHALADEINGEFTAHQSKCQEIKRQNQVLMAQIRIKRSQAQKEGSRQIEQFDRVEAQKRNKKCIVF